MGGGGGGGGGGEGYISRNGLNAGKWGKLGRE